MEHIALTPGANHMTFHFFVSPVTQTYFARHYDDSACYVVVYCCDEPNGPSACTLIIY
jgi:hypothetical protein